MQLSLGNKVCLTALAIALSTPVLAQTEPQTDPKTSPESAQAPAAPSPGDIIVTAERRAVNVQKVPLSVTVRSGEDLRQQGRNSLAQILENVAGVSGGGSLGTSGGGSDTPETGVSIRGVPSNASAAGSILSAVPTTAVYVDEVYSGVGGGYDIDRVEVLRGPQGTLYGRSATAGVITTHTADPSTEEFSGWGLAEIGNYDLRHLSGAINVPISDTVALRVSGNHFSRDGYDARDGGAFRSTDGRAKLLLKPTDNLSAVLGVAFQDNVTHTGEYSLQVTAPDEFTKVPIDIATGHNRFRQYWANINWELGGISLTYIPAYRTWHQDADILVANGPTVLAQRQYTPKDNFLTQELRIASSDSAKFTWQTGAFYYDNKIESQNSAELQSNGALAYSGLTHKTTRNLGIYAEGTYHLTQTLRFSGGLRYDHTYVRNEQDYTANLNFGAGIPGTPEFSYPEVLVTKSVSGDEATRRFNNITYKARLEYDLNPDSLVYASVASAFLPGDVQVASGADNQPIVLPYKEETLTSYEIGSKNRFFGGVLQVNGALFFYDYGGYQTAVNIGSAFAPSFIQITAPAQMKGGEVEIFVRPGSQDRLGINASYVDARFVNRSEATKAYISQTRIPNIPSTSANAFWEHRFDLASGSTFTLRGEVVYRSSYDLAAISAADKAAGGLDYVKADDQVLGNVNLNWTSADKRFSLSGYVRNVTNSRTASTLSVLSISPSLSITGTRTDPRTYGIVAQAKF
ncbi:TonB-dependent receptor [Novosphingobium sp. Rr 2-17]|nr:TonB-dependent receptor [Novosphingobium sp. Rr 2-17]